MHEILAQPAAENHRTHRKITPSTVPAATSTLKISKASKSVRSSLMIVTSFIHNEG